MLIFLLFLLNLFKYFLCYKFEDFEIDLKSKHKINETTIITQETLQRIITGAEKGDKGKVLHVIITIIILIIIILIIILVR